MSVANANVSFRTGRWRVAALIALPVLLTSCSRKQSSSPHANNHKPNAATPLATAMPTAGVATAAIAAIPSVADGNVAVSAGVRAPDWILQSGHTMGVTTLAFSPDGKWIATGAYDNAVILWNVETGEEIRRMTAHQSPVMEVGFSPDGRKVISCDQNGGVLGWDASAGTTVFALNVHSLCRQIAFTRDGQRWAIGVAETAEDSNDARIELRSSITGVLVKTIKTDWAGFTALTITHDGKLVASGGAEAEDEEADLYTREWDPSSGVEIRKTHAGGIAFAPDGETVLHPDSENRAMELLRTADGTKTWEQKIASSELAAFSGDGDKIALAELNSASMRLLSVASGEVVREIPAGSADKTYQLQTMEFSPDGRSIAAGPYADGEIRILDVATGEVKRSLFGQVAVTGVAASPDGQWLAVGSMRSLSLWDLRARKLAKTLWSGSVNQIAFSADGRWLAANAGSRFPGETLKVWDTRTWTIAGDFSFSQKGTPVFSIAFVPPDAGMAELGPLSRVFDFADGNEKRAVWSAPSPVAATADGRLLAAKSGIGGDVDVWDLHSGKKLTTIAAHRIGVSTLAFSAGGKWLLSSGQETPVTFVRPGQIGPVEMQVKLWDTQTWNVHQSWTFNRMGAGTAAISPDSRIVAVEKDWNLVELIDIASGASVGTFVTADPRAQNRPFSSGNLLISPDGALLMQAAVNGVRVWKLRDVQTAARSSQ